MTFLFVPTTRRRRSRCRITSRCLNQGRVEQAAVRRISICGRARGSCFVPRRDELGERHGRASRVYPDQPPRAERAASAPCLHASRIPHFSATASMSNPSWRAAKASSPRCPERRDVLLPAIRYTFGGTRKTSCGSPTRANDEIAGGVPGSRRTVLAVLFLAPLLIVLAYSFLSRGAYGGVDPSWTVENWKRLADPIYLGILAPHIRDCRVSTAICLLLGFPTGPFHLAVRVAEEPVSQPRDPAVLDQLPRAHVLVDVPSA